MIAKAEITKPTAAALTPKDLAYKGIDGTITPYPIATKNEAMIKVWTSLGKRRQTFSFLTEGLSGCIFTRLLVILAGSKWKLAKEIGNYESNEDNWRCGVEDHVE